MMTTTLEGNTLRVSFRIDVQLLRHIIRVCEIAVRQFAWNVLNGWIICRTAFNSIITIEDWTKPAPFECLNISCSKSTQKNTLPLAVCPRLGSFGILIRVDISWALTRHASTIATCFCLMLPIELVPSVLWSSWAYTFYHEMPMHYESINGIPNDLLSNVQATFSLSFSFSRSDTQKSI